MPSRGAEGIPVSSNFYQSRNDGGSSSFTLGINAEDYAKEVLPVLKAWQPAAPAEIAGAA